VAGKPGPRLWVIDPSIHRRERQGVRRILDGWPGPSEIFAPALDPSRGPGPGTGHETDGVVLLGSAASVHDDLPWLRDLSDWLVPLLDGSIPIPLLGICFGHQWIAHLGGGEVGFLGADRKKRVGVEPTDLDGGRLVPGRHRLRVVVSHREEVRRPPAGYRVVARRGPIAVDGLEHETLPVFSFQFHPEAGEEFATHA